MLHAVEKPMNLDYVKPFANTTDLINFTPNIDEKLAAAKEEERIFKIRRGEADQENTPIEEIVLTEERSDAAD